MRTNASRFHIRPSVALNATILGIIGRALALYPVSLHAIVFLSNHWHALLTPCDGEALSRFLQYVNGNIAKAAQALNGVKGRVWSRRASVIHVLDEHAQLRRLRYLHAHGTKEGLVSCPLQWPGITSARALAGEETLVGHWEDRTLRRRLERGGRAPHPSEYTMTYPIELEPLPVHARLTAAERQREIRAMIAEIVDEYAARPVLGVNGVLAQDPDHTPVRSKQGRGPAVHATSEALVERYFAVRAAFVAAYRAAARRHAERPTAARWPLDAFLPAIQFIVQRDDRVRSPPLFEMVA